MLHGRGFLVLRVVCGTVVALGTLLGGCGSKTFKSEGKPNQPAQESPAPQGKESPAPIAPAGLNQTISPKPAGTNTVTGSLQQTCSSGSLKQDVIRVRIPANAGSRCDWGKNGNLSQSGAKLAARIERNFEIAVPNNRKVCGMSAESDNQKIRYDDQLFLTLNGNVLLSSSREVSRLDGAQNGFKQYNWEKLRGASTGEERFCAAGVSCQLPKSEEFGKFSFVIDQQTSYRLFESLRNQRIWFGLIVTGDDDNLSDCQLYNDIDLKVSYSYVE